MAAELDLDDVAAQSKKAVQELADLRKDAERYRKLRRDFAAMSVYMDGQHVWVHRRALALRGPTLDAAVDDLPDR